MSTIGSSLSKGEDGTALINPVVLRQIAGVPKDMSRAAFDAAVTQERTNIANNGAGIWSNGEKISIFGEVGTRIWSVGASASLSHARNVSYQGQVYALTADANVFGSTVGAPASGTGANGDYLVDAAAGLVYGPKAGGAWPAGVPALAVPSKGIPDLDAIATLLGTYLTALSDPSGALGRATLAQVLAWMLANDGSVDLAQAPVASALTDVAYVPSIKSDGTLMRLPTSLIGTSSGSSGSGGSGTTSSPATTYTITTASTGTAGTAQTVTVATTGTLSSAVVVTLTDGASGAFAGTVTLAAGTNSSGSTQYTPASAGSHTISGTNNGSLANPSGPSVTVAAASSGGSSSTPALTMASPTYADNGVGDGTKMLTSGTGTTPITLPQGFVAKVKVKMGTDYQYNSTPFLSFTEGATGDTLGMAMNNRTACCYLGYSQYAGVKGDDGSSFTDGAVHEYAFAVDSGSMYAYVDGTQHSNLATVNGFQTFGASTMTIGVNAGTSGVFDVRIYAGSMASLGALVAEWKLNGSGAAS